jgi:hypothetical protein
MNLHLTKVIKLLNFNIYIIELEETISQNKDKKNEK